MTVGIFGGLILFMFACSLAALIWAMVGVVGDNLKKKKENE